MWVGPTLPLPTPVVMHLHYCEMEALPVVWPLLPDMLQSCVFSGWHSIQCAQVQGLCMSARR